MKLLNYNLAVLLNYCFALLGVADPNYWFF